MISPSSILTIYIILFIFKFAWENFLDWLNIKEARSTSLPSFAKNFISQDNFKKSGDYTVTRTRFSILSSSISSLVIFIITVSGFLGTLDRWLISFMGSSSTHGIVLILLLSFITELVSLPFSLYSQFVIEERFGFNKMTLKLFFADMFKSLTLSLILTVPLLYLLFWFMRATGGLWWLWAFGIYTLIQILMVLIYPALIAPLFNKFTPLEEGSLQEKIFALAEKLSFRAKGIFMMDGSRRSRHSNAYFTGIGRVKRIVLFDTLINTLKEEEVVAVLAHEIGHEKKNHTRKLLLLSLFSMLGGFFLLSLLLQFPPLFEAFGFDGPGYHSVLILLIFCTGPFTFLFKPLGSILSRKYEYEADRYAVENLGSPENLKNALLTLTSSNLGNLTPHRLYSFYHYSHPTLGERIKAMEKISSE